MGTLNNKLEYLNETKQKIKNIINYSNPGLTSSTPFRDYVKQLYNGYINILNDKYSVLNNMPKETKMGVNIKTNDAANIDLYGLEIYKETTQETTTGKNKLETSLEIIKSVNSNGTWSGNVYTYNGITYTINDDLSVLVNGTASGASYLYIKTNGLNLVENTEYRINGCPSGGSTTTYSIRLYDGNDYSSNTNANGTNEGISFTYSTQDAVRINIYSGSTANNLLFKPMIRLSTETNNIYEPYTGGIASPNPDYPQDVETMVGYRNLCDILLNNSVTTTIQYKTYTLKANTQYTIITNTWPVDATVANIFVAPGTELTPNSATNGVKYLKTIISDSNGNITIGYRNYQNNLDYSSGDYYVQITEGTKEKPYVPYGTNYMLLDEVGKNLFDKSSTLTVGYLYSNGSANAENSNWRTTDFIYIKPNTYYATSFLTNGGENPSRCYYDKNKNFISGTAHSNNAPFIDISPNNAYYMKESIRNEEINNIQIEQCKQYLISLANQELLNKNDYVDKIIIDGNTGQMYIEKKWGKVVLNGSENIVLESSLTNCNRFILKNVLSSFSSNPIIAISDYFKFEINYTKDKQHFYIGSSGGIFLFVPNNIASTVQQLQIWLSTHNVKIYYPLQTPQLIPIDNPNIKLLNGINHITNSEDADMKIEYIKNFDSLE